ncbi:cupin domain-containing protein [Candidatus Pacearchaeota archaeon]|nr:cupin domain-containing protein [Candidatus Pacearchaeota archaeon]
MKAQIIHPDPNTEFFFEEGCHILELLNSNDDENLSIARARVEPGETTRLHRLHGIVERYIILEGQGEVVLDQSSAKEVSTGDVVVIPEKCPQKITNTGNNDLVFLAICTPRFNPEAYEDIDNISD